MIIILAWFTSRIEMSGNDERSLVSGVTFASVSDNRCLSPTIQRRSYLSLSPSLHSLHCSATNLPTVCVSVCTDWHRHNTLHTSQTKAIHRHVISSIDFPVTVVASCRWDV